MLDQLSIKNYALLQDVTIDFNKGLTVITGETGSGKSLLLGSLEVLLGKRISKNQLFSTDKKCTLEGIFDIKNYQLKAFFEKNNLDYEDQTIIRREILTSGKSRCFINDTPVTINVINEFKNLVIDIHNQHQTLSITQESFQLNVLDALAKTSVELKAYKELLSKYTSKKQELLDLQKQQASFIKERDYLEFLYKELQDAQLEQVNLKKLETTYATLQHIEQLQAHSNEILQHLQQEDSGVLTQLQQCITSCKKMSGVNTQYNTLQKRLESIVIELDDLTMEFSDKTLELEANPNQLYELENKINQIHQLCQKHQLGEVSELLELQESLEKKLNKDQNSSKLTEELQKEITALEKQLDQYCEKIHQKREKALPQLTKGIVSIIQDMGMEYASFSTKLENSKTYLSTGKDQLRLLFSANKGSNLGTLKEVASGGERSRIMLAIKSILSQYQKLPTIIFDEIDTGVSGDIAQRMARLMQKMSKQMQVIVITHLPQVAATGDEHLKIYKSHQSEQTQTHIEVLDKEQRIQEIAQMISGTKQSVSAITHAESLLAHLDL